MDIPDELFEEVLAEQQSKEGRNPRRETYRKRVKQAYDVLIERASQGELITYGELMDQIGTGRGYIGAVIGGVSRLEIKQERPPLSALVVRKGTEYPGDGFCENLLADIDKWQPGEDRETAWRRERDCVFEYWGGE